MKTQITRNILVPIDFSNMSIQAIETAKGLARRFGGSVHLVHVHHFDYPVGFTAPFPPLMPFSLVTYSQDMEKILRRRLNDVAKKHGLASANCHVRTGTPAFDEICALAQEMPADLIVTPTHGRTGFKHVFLGSTAERIVQHSPVPVFVARGSTPKSIKTILVPVDFSGCSLEGLKYAIDFANEFGAKIILLHVVELGYAYTADGFAMYDMSEPIEAARQDGERQMREFVRAANFQQVKFEAVVRTGHAAQEICGYVKEHDVGLIVTATHGRTGFEHVFMGSTAEQVVRHACCPVLVVPSHPKIRKANLLRHQERSIKSPRRIGNRNGRKFLVESKKFDRRYRKLGVHAFPERRKTNKFRESHIA